MFTFDTLDETLREMTKESPMCEDELLNVTGVTAAKAKRYGDRFLQVILANSYSADINDFGKCLLVTGVLS